MSGPLVGGQPMGQGRGGAPHLTRPPYRCAVGLMIKTDEVSEQGCGRGPMHRPGLHVPAALKGYGRGPHGRAHTARATC